jgi:hypothetical protein
MILRVAVATWNVGGSASLPSSDGVPRDAPLLLTSLPPGVDLAVVGLQEVPRPGRGWKAAVRAGLPDRWTGVCRMPVRGDACRIAGARPLEGEGTAIESYARRVGRRGRVAE